jgi:hypothetical protein
MEKPTSYRLLADENTSHRFVAACRRLFKEFPIVHIAMWEGGSWLGLDDVALLVACAEHSLVLVAFDRATLPWHAARVLRAGESHGGLVLFRRSVRSTDYGHQARLLTTFWTEEGAQWDWGNRIVYLPKAPDQGRRTDQGRGTKGPGKKKASPLAREAHGLTTEKR